ncbi:MAG TPA: cupin domain-containing protein [Bacteroidia bacterium]|nr:cupin domain-containing protein [Bacteroidia bacterium]
MKTKGLLLTAITLLMQLVYAQVHISIDTIGKFSKTENLYVKSTSSDSLASGFIIVIKKEVKLHKHLNHSEHVLVIEGEGQMQLGDKTFTIKPNDLIFIPKNTPHKVITTSKKPLKVLSIQSPNFDGKDRVMLE